MAPNWLFLGYTIHRELIKLREKKLAPAEMAESNLSLAEEFGQVTQTLAFFQYGGQVGGRVGHIQ